MPTTLVERKAALLTQAMALSKRQQDLSAELQTVQQEMLKTAGAIDVMDALIAEVPGGE